MALRTEDLSDSDCYFSEYACYGACGFYGGDNPVYVFTRHSGEIYALACSPIDSTLVATGGGDARGFLWKIFQRDGGAKLHGHSDSVSCLAFSYDGQFLASGSLDRIVQIWDGYGNLKGALDGPKGGIEWLRWHPSEHILLAGSDDSTAWMWNGDKDSLNIFSGHSGSVTCGDFTPDGEIICTGSDDASLRIWNAKSGESIHVVQGHPYRPYHTEGLTCLATSPSSTLALSGSKDGSVYIVNVTTGKVINTLAPHSDSIECVGFAPSDSLAAIGGFDEKLIIWDIEHSLSRGTCDHKGGVTCLAWLGASYVATGCTDGNVRLWDSRSSECVRTFQGHSDMIQSIEVSANHKYLVSSSLDGKACVFEVNVPQ